MRHQFLETNVSLTFGAAFCFVVLPMAIGRVVFWLRSTMDSISDSDSEDAGSIPAEAT